MRKWVPVLFAATALLGACSNDVEPKAVAEPTRWDPCSITPEQIAATGLDPDYRDVGWGRGVDVPDWARCSFKPMDKEVRYFLVVMSSLNHTVAEARAKPSNASGKDLVIAGREAYQYETDVGTSVDDCNVAVDLSPGVLLFSVNYMRAGDGIDPCQVLLDHVSDLKDSVPF